MRRIVFEHVLHVVDGDERVVDGDDLHVGVVARRAHHQAADAAKACERGEGIKT